MKDSTVLNADLAPGPLALGFSRIKLSKHPKGSADPHAGDCHVISDGERLT